MDSQTYIKNAVRTESVPAELIINQTALHAALELAIAATAILDQVKRKLYYGRDITIDKIEPHVNHIIGMANYFGGLVDDGEVNSTLSADALARINLPPNIAGMKLSNLNIRLLHAALGMFTESGELVEAMQRQYETGQLDKVNFGEETGDSDWYKAIALDETGVSEEIIRARNIAKLQARYPDKFTSEAALNRNLAVERATLEA